jgi:hypothetical protein
MDNQGQQGFNGVGAMMRSSHAHFRRNRPGNTAPEGVNQMDADRNGIPCETVYSAAAVDNLWYQ